jgi:lactate dehydrogenase-like 2-hydroxyacid dehydrogenase
MKDNATLINTSRGEIADETELIEFLDNNKSLLLFKNLRFLVCLRCILR